MGRKRCAGIYKMLRDPTVPRFCELCMPVGAVDVVSLTCVCGRAAADFGFAGQSRKQAQFCKECKPQGALNVVNKK
eukprot:scaffold405003_cov44-Prasinocladus_malaysianus.AAC.1